MSQDYDGSVFEKKRLEMSEFIARELLYDYMLDRLDNRRKKSVEAMLANSKTNREDLARLRAGAKYCEGLCKTNVTEDLLSDLESSRSLWKNFIRAADARNWPPPVRWSIEGLVIAIFVGLVISRLPLNKLLFKDGPSDVLMTQVSRGNRTSGEMEVKQSLNTASVNNEGPRPRPVVAEKETRSERKQDKKVAANNLSQKSDLKKSIVSKPVKKLGLQATLAKPIAVPPRPTPVDSKGGNAFVYRLYIYPSDVDSISPNVVKDIVGLNGEKAGEVELGWKKGNGRYYHFKMGSKNHDKLVDLLKAYGSVRIRKSKHVRVMPVNEFRYILWMEARSN